MAPTAKQFSLPNWLPAAKQFSLLNWLPAANQFSLPNWAACMNQFSLPISTISLLGRNDLNASNNFMV
jgi:hypothetical protein